MRLNACESTALCHCLPFSLNSLKGERTDGPSRLMFDGVIGFPMSVKTSAESDLLFEVDGNLTLCLLFLFFVITPEMTVKIH